MLSEGDDLKLQWLSRTELNSHQNSECRDCKLRPVLKLIRNGIAMGFLCEKHGRINAAREDLPFPVAPERKK
jgi:hypothetical protein